MAGNIWWQVASGRGRDRSFHHLHSDAPTPGNRTRARPTARPPSSPPPAGVVGRFVLPTLLVSERRPHSSPRPTPLSRSNPPCSHARNERPRPRIFPPAILRPEPIIPAITPASPPCQVWFAHPALVCPHLVHGPQTPSTHPDSSLRPSLIRAHRPRFPPPRVLPPQGEESR